MTTYSFRVLRIIDQYNPVSDDFDTLDARTLDGSISLIGDTNFLPYMPLPGSSDEDGLEIEVDGSMVGSFIVDGQIIDGEDASTSLISLTWNNNGVQQSTTILAINFEDPFSGIETAYAFVVGGAPLPEFTSAAMFDAFDEAFTSFGLPLLHNPGPGDTIDMSAIPGVTTSENDYIRVPDDSFSNVLSSSGSDTIDFSDSYFSTVYLNYADTAGPMTCH